jgi:hypothetical protein
LCFISTKNFYKKNPAYCQSGKVLLNHPVPGSRFHALFYKAQFQKADAAGDPVNLLSIAGKKVLPD